MDKPLRGPALSEAIRTYIKDYIIQNRLEPGDPLPPETELMDELGVGRSSVREAVKALQSLGIVEIRRGDGLYVRSANFDPVLEILDFSMRFDPRIFAEVFRIRVWLESAVIEDAVRQIGEEDINRLEDLMMSWEQRVALGKSFADLDEEFHCILYQSLGNRTLVNLFDVFWTAFANLDIDEVRTADPQIALADHWELFKIVKSRDTVLARERLIEHFSHVSDRIEREFGPKGQVVLEPASAAPVRWLNATVRITTQTVPVHEVR